MILIKDVVKIFGKQQILKNISFEIKQGEIVGFLGQNGAGKTTLMRIITSYLSATSGEVFIAGKNVAHNTLVIRQKIGYLPETPPLYDNMIVHDYLKFAAKLKDVPVKQQSVQVERVLSQCHLQEVRHEMIGILSKGYRQRIGIAQAIIHNPAILILDEPTNGLDPVQILQVRKLIKSLESQCTVLISTHILSEIEQLAQRVLMIKSGKIIADDTLDNLLQGKSLEKVFFQLNGLSYD
ncbi:Gliding motility-associated ABC transporter ATP-binding protein GldA [hydrothermal vent metagenome]|uniref:Gliding motility-associated ABC transporter ATP-binding protein GldA n=1 Tax=hydrothermal vent metagenome TaxID=652676 RepID=A0A3B1D1J9_9ZZZZ